MDFRKYEVFLRAVECGSLTSAGEELGYTQSGVSHMMKGLEEELGFRLLSRGKSGVELTREGERIIPVIRELSKWNEQLNQITAQIKGFEMGRIRIGSLASISFHWLPQILIHFQKDFPNIEIDIMDGGENEVERWLNEKRVDIGFLSIRANSSFDTVPLRRDRFMAVLPPDYPRGGRKSFPLTNFNNQSFIISAHGTDFDIHDMLAQYKIIPTVKFSSTDDHTIVAMVQCGLGVSILPELILEGHKDRVCALPLKPGVSRTLGVAVPSLKDVSPATKRFLGYVVSVLQEQ